MAVKTLAVKYRPQTWNDVTEQSSVKVILKQQLESGEIKNAYLFTGPAGCGKTTCARIFANEINKGEGNPIEMDAASNSGVDDVREIIQQARTKSIDSEYKVFIIDECHSISNTGWQAFLKLIEEPPATSVFIFCTTDPQKIPKTILSRVQRYDFQRISQDGIVNRLRHICDMELTDDSGCVRLEALEYIAKIADGGMRDAISLMDKCLAYSPELTLGNVVSALGTVDFDTMIELTDNFRGIDSKSVIEVVERVHNSGKDLKQFMKQYTQFLLDVSKYGIGCDWKYISIPRLNTYEDWLGSFTPQSYEKIDVLLSMSVNLNADIKYSLAPKYDIEATFLITCNELAEDFEE